MQPLPRLLPSLLIAASLIACSGGGGGGGGGNSPAAPEPAPAAPPPVTPTTGNSLPGPRPVAEPRAFVNYESGQVRPLALAADGRYLYALNTPDNKLEIFQLGSELVHRASVPVGLEPVALAGGSPGAYLGRQPPVR